MEQALELFIYYTRGLVSLEDCEKGLAQLGTDYDTVSALYNSTRRV